MNIIVTSQSKVKLDAVKNKFPRSNIRSVISSAQLPAQPINSGLACAHRRIDGILDKIDLNDVDLILSIENGIDTINHWEKGGDGNHFIDICYVVGQLRSGDRIEASSFGVRIPSVFVRAAQAATDLNYPYRDMGYQISAGEMIAKSFPHIDHADWMKDAMFGGRSRIEQIKDAIRVELFRQ